MKRTKQKPKITKSKHKLENEVKDEKRGMEKMEVAHHFRGWTNPKMSGVSSLEP